jgi:hypothetical protein
MSHEVRNSLVGGGLASIVICPTLYALDQIEGYDFELPVEEVFFGSLGLASVVALVGLASCLGNKHRD